MALTVYDVESRARDILSDSFANNYRWNTVNLIRVIYDGVRMLNSIRPESRYFNGTLTTLSVPTLADGADADAVSGYRAATISIDERWSEALVHYAVYKSLEIDSSDTGNAARSQYHKAEFERIAKS